MKAFYRERPIISVCLAVSILMVIFILQIIFTPLFFIVEEFSVSGQAYLSTADVITLSAISTGDSLITTSVNKAEEALLTNQWVKSVEVQKIWPNTVEIQLQERVPYLAIPHHSGFIITSNEGIVIDIRTDFSSVNLPVLNGYVADNVTVGTPIMSENAWENINNICSNIPESFMCQLSEIYWYRDEVSLFTLDGLEIILGDINKFDPTRLKMLPEIMDSIADKEKGYLDLSGIYAVFRKL